jgi:hypothetical protein
MQNLYIEKTENTPEINFSPEENIFLIQGTSSPEDVRALYYPVIDWIKIFIDDILNGEYRNFNKNNPLKFRIDMSYFNSSSAKFFYDIFCELKRVSASDIPFDVEWYYDEEDNDMREAGADISQLSELEFKFIAKPKEY